MAPPVNAHHSNIQDARNIPHPDDQYHFVCVQNPSDAKDRTVMRLARSHAVARGLKNKRERQQKSGRNFRITCVKSNTTRSTIQSKQSQAVAESSRIFSETSTPGLFQLLAEESPSLRTLLSHYRSQQATEPVFSISDELVLRNFRSILREGQNASDHALLSAVMLTFTFAATAGSIDGDFLKYRNEALSSVRQRMSSPHTAISETTMGAILLLAGIEAWSGMPCQVQLHMGAIRQLLDMCRTNGVHLSDGLKRAIFWQDLNSSAMTGSSRIVDHTTFTELRWIRDPFSPSYFILPPGFQAHFELLGVEFTEVLKDIYALQCIRDSSFFDIEDVISMAQIDNHQASVQSRLINLSNRSSISECCHLAAYLCSAMLRCKLWRASTIPLLYKLQQSNDNLVWNDLPELLTWLLHIGGAFAPTGTIRSAYVVLLHLNRSIRLRGLYESWSEVLNILKQFIWSDSAFMAQVKSFWEESCTERGPTEVYL